MKAPVSRKTLLSFYCDDTNPAAAGPRAFRTFLDFCAANGIAGESSVILGMSGASMTRAPSADEREYLAEVRRAWDCGIDSHMEIMTHGDRFDFAANRPRTGAGHEGLWLYEPAVTAEEYEGYLSSILAEGDRAGVKFTGLTWPGCSCDVCSRRYAELQAADAYRPNPNLWKALLNLAKAGRFRGSAIPCFFESSETDFGLHLKETDGAHAVCDLSPNAGDWFGSWGNGADYVNPDYYITADGSSGIIPRHVNAGDPYCLFYAHWQGFNPGNGVGWKAFTTVVDRVRTHLGPQVTWMRPSEIAERHLAAGGWDFREPVVGGR
ncbi:MAG: hypothetical protein AAB152_06545 [Candidatus Coatesbacteria bacterium]